LGPNLGVFPLE